MNENTAATEHMVDGVKIVVREGDTGFFFATSPDVKGLLVAEPTREAVLAAVPEALKTLKLVEEIMERDDAILKELADN